MASKSIAHSAFGVMGYWLRAHSGSRNKFQQFTSNSEIKETISSMVAKSQVTTLNFIYNCQNLRQQQ